VRAYLLTTTAAVALLAPGMPAVPPTSRRGRHSPTQRGLVLVASACFGALATLGPTAGYATDGTWTGPGNEWTTGTNWSSTPTVPDNTATFTNNGAPTSVTIAIPAAINTIQFTAAAPTYSFTNFNSGTITINGAGIVNNSAFAAELYQ
jgi:hypothetical protein